MRSGFGETSYKASRGLWGTLEQESGNENEEKLSYEKF